MHHIPFAPWMRGSQALDMVRNAGGPRRSSASLTYYGAVLQAHQALTGEVWSAEAWMEIARGHLMRSDLEAAERALTQAGLIRTPDPALGLLLAEIWLATDRAERAVKILTNLVEQRPGVARAHYLLGLARRDLGLDDEADAYRAAVAADPTLVDAWYRLGNCLGLARRPGEAIDSWREALRVEPDHVGALFNLGKALHLADDVEGAADCLDRLRELDAATAALLELSLEPAKPIPAGVRVRRYGAAREPKGRSGS